MVIAVIIRLDGTGSAGQQTVHTATSYQVALRRAVSLPVSPAEI